MHIPSSLREMNPAIDSLARGERPLGGAVPGLAVALGLAAPDGSLTEVGRAYARPTLAAGPPSLVMCPERRAVAAELVGGPLPLQASLRRLLRQIAERDEALVAPQGLGWPEALLRPYLTYLEDLGLLLPIGPLVEITPLGRTVVGQAPPVAAWAALEAVAPVSRVPDPHSAVFRYHVIRHLCLAMTVMRGRREWHLLQPLLDGPLAPLAPAYNEWCSRFLAAQPTVRRSWGPELVAEFVGRRPEPAWFGEWCRVLLGCSVDGLVETLAAAPAFLREPPVLAGGNLDRPTWLMATAVAGAGAQGWTVRYAEASARIELDGVLVPSRLAMHAALEDAGLLVTDQQEVRLLAPVVVEPPAEALWPYAGPDWLVAALLEGGAFGMPRRGLKS